MISQPPVLNTSCRRSTPSETTFLFQTQLLALIPLLLEIPYWSCEVFWTRSHPTTLLYDILDILLPTITSIINTSFTTGIVPCDLKTAFGKNVLKKPPLDKNLLKNKNKQKTTALSQTYSCPKSFKKSFFTNFFPIFKKTTSAISFSQRIMQVTALKPSYYVLYTTFSPLLTMTIFLFFCC